MKRLLLLVMLFGISGHAAVASQADLSPKEKESYLHKADKKVQEATSKVKSVQERSEATGVKSRQEFDRHLKELREIIDDARKKMNDLWVAIVNAWERFRKEMDRMLAGAKGQTQKVVPAVHSKAKK